MTIANGVWVSFDDEHRIECGASGPGQSAAIASISISQAASQFPQTQADEERRHRVEVGNGDADMVEVPYVRH